MNPDGVVVDEFTFPNDAEGIHDLASRLTTEDRVVMESTGIVWSTLYNNLDERHIPVTLANPLKTRAIASARIKTDKVDARILAHLLRGDLVAECYVPPKDIREIRALVRHRASLVKIRTMAIEPGPQSPGQVRAQRPRAGAPSSGPDKLQTVPRVP